MIIIIIITTIHGIHIQVCEEQIKAFIFLILKILRFFKSYVNHYIPIKYLFLTNPEIILYPDIYYDDHDHHHHHHVEETTTTEAPAPVEPRVKKYSYYYLGRKLWYIPLYFTFWYVSNNVNMTIKQKWTKSITTNSRYFFILFVLRNFRFCLYVAALIIRSIGRHKVN